MFELFFQVKGAVDVRLREHARDVGIGLEKGLEIALLGERQHGVALHPFVGLLARHAFLRQFEQHGAREHDAARSIEILVHPIRMHRHPPHDAREAAQHVIERDEAVRQNDPLDRRMGNIAFVPQGDVLEGRLGVGPNQAREPDDLLAPDRIAFVRHRRRALLPFAERLLELADLGFLEPAHLQCEFLERGAGDGEHRQELRVPIALDHLRGDGRRLEAEPLADVGFDLRRQMREGADGARQLADADDRARAAYALDVAADLGVPERQLQPERHRLRVDAVGPPDHRRVPMLERPVADGLGQRVEIAQNEIARLAHLDRLRGVDDVGGGHAEVQPPRRGPHVLGDRRRERNHVMLRRLLDLFDARDVEGAALADVARGLGRHDAGGGHRVGRGGLHEQPGLVSTLVAPDPPHVGVGVPGNHLFEIEPFGRNL